ncbi:MAG: hypothetical protein NVS1B1_02640 [Candidatus Limnocylindrales bacterium]
MDDGRRRHAEVAPKGTLNMAAALDTLLAEARSQDLIQPLGAFEVHCHHCHARLSGTGDCTTCGMIGRTEAELMRRATGDSAGIERLLEISIARRKNYEPGTKAKAK